MVSFNVSVFSTECTKVDAMSMSVQQKFYDLTTVERMRCFMCKIKLSIKLSIEHINTKDTCMYR